MALVSSCGSKFAQLVTYHVLRNVYGNVLSAVMNGKGMTYEIGVDS